MNLERYAIGTTHLGLPTSCYDETVTFYKNFGFSEQFFLQFADGERIIFLQLKNLLLEIYESEHTPGVAGAVDHIAIDVDNIEAVFQEIKAEGHILLDDHICQMPFWENGEKYFTIQGPNGEKIEFVQILCKRQIKNTEAEENPSISVF